VIAQRGSGNCYEAAIAFVKSRPWTEQQRYRICHGTAFGRGGDAAGKWFAHAWVEYDLPVPGLAEPVVMVIDRSNGLAVHTTQAAYYRLGRIGDETVRRYSWRTANIWMGRLSHYGPWEEPVDPERRGRARRKRERPRVMTR
jgi:hypothetical protein